MFGSFGFLGFWEFGFAVFCVLCFEDTGVFRASGFEFLWMLGVWGFRVGLLGFRVFGFRVFRI